MRRIYIIATLLFLLVSIQPARAEWIKQNTNSFAWFKDISFTDDRHGWIVGSDGIMLLTPDGGETWLQAKKFTNDTILQIHFTSEKVGWILCERNPYARGSNATSYLRKTVDGGITWDRIEFVDGGRERVTKLIFNADGAGMAFGEGGIFYKLQEDGVTWKKTPTAIHYLLLDGAYSSGPIGAIVGSGGTIMFTEDNGFTWEKATVLGDTSARINSVCFIDKAAWAVGSQGRIYHTTGGARLWRQQDSTVTANLNDVYFQNAASGWAVGDNGIIVRTRDGGTTWTDVDSHVTHRLEKIIFANGRGWAVGYGGTVLTYSDDPGAKDPGVKPSLQKRN